MGRLGLGAGETSLTDGHPGPLELHIRWLLVFPAICSLEFEGDDKEGWFLVFVVVVVVPPACPTVQELKFKTHSLLFKKTSFYSGDCELPLSLCVWALFRPHLPVVRLLSKAWTCPAVG